MEGAAFGGSGRFGGTGCGLACSFWIGYDDTLSKNNGCVIKLTFVFSEMVKAGRSTISGGDVAG